LQEFLVGNGNIYGPEHASLRSLFYLVDLLSNGSETMQTELFAQEEDRSEIWSITEITQAIRKSLQTQFPVVWIRGEISNLRSQASGHRYFCLKDENCQIKAVFFRGDAAASSYLPKEGDDCLAFGEITVYEPRGEYQLRVRHLLQDGLGNLSLQFEKLKEKLLQEGVFDEKGKKDLPALAQTIAIITSPDGAALQDFLEILKRRNWTGTIWLVPSLVQGNEAAKQIISGIEYASKIPDLDLLVLARGGGSIEDLWSFNDEELVRAVANCSIPTISAIGHQTDFVLTDFAADFRAETPSAAAEWISSRYLEQINRLDQLEQKLIQIPQYYLSLISEKIAYLGAALEKLSPHARMDRYHQQLDDLEHRLQISIRNHLKIKLDRLKALEQRLHANSLPAAMKRGFSYLSDNNGHLIRSVKELPSGKQVRAHLGDGSRVVEVLREDLN
jgi:exodeoxyribonuclease VII large subunit